MKLTKAQLELLGRAAGAKEENEYTVRVRAQQHATAYKLSELKLVTIQLWDMGRTRVRITDAGRREFHLHTCFSCRQKGYVHPDHATALKGSP